MTASLRLLCLCLVALALSAGVGGAAEHGRPGLHGTMSPYRVAVGPGCGRTNDYCGAPWYCVLSDRLPTQCQMDDFWGAFFYKPWIKWTTLGLLAAFVLFLLAALF